LIFAPALALFLTALFALWPSIEPRRANLASSRVPYAVGWIGAVGILAGVHIVIVMTARGVVLDVAGYAVAGVSILLIALGNFLGKSRANFFLGVRTPWSLSSDLSWEKSNRLSGRLFVVTGIVTLGALVAMGQAAALYTLISGTVVSAICGIAASYVYWKRDPDGHAGDGILE
ncbi:MAG TPA: SdpI family protein, partial [Rhizomicrobium sp.]